MKKSENSKANTKSQKNTVNAEATYDVLLKKIFLLILALIGIIFLLFNLKTVFDIINRVLSSLSPVIIGVALAYTMHPFYQFIAEKLEEKPFHIKELKLRKIYATIATILLLLIIVIGLLYLLIPEIYTSISNIIANFDNYYASFNEFIDKLIGQNAFLYENVNNALNEMKNFVQTTILPNLRSLVTNISQGIVVTANAIINFFIGIIVMMYVINMRDETVAFLNKFVHTIFKKDFAEKINEEAKYANTVFVGFISGKILDSVIVSIICVIFMFIARMPYAILISVIIGITNIIPFFGPFIGTIPSFILIALVDPFKAVVFVIFTLVLQQIDGNIIGPKILGDTIGMDSFFVLFSILLFGGLFGFAGMMLGVPVFAVLQRIITKLMDSKLKSENLPTDLEAYKVE